MKKFFTFTAALFAACSISLAQSKGEIAVDGTFGLNAGSVGANSSSVSFDIYAGASYFVMDNFRLSLDLGYEINSQRSGIADTDSYVKSNQGAFIINPNVAYYFKIFDKFYYTPEIGLCFKMGSTTNYAADRSDGTLVTSKYSDDFVFGVYANFLSAEYRFNRNFAICGQFGTIGFESSTATLQAGRNKVGNNFFLFGLNNAALGVRYFF